MVDARRPSIGPAVFAWSGAVVFLLSLLYFLYAYLIRFGSSATSDAHRRTGRLAPIAIDIALFTIFALHHSIAARASIKSRVQRVVPPWLERSVYTWTASLLFLATCIWWQPVPGELYRLTGLATVPAYAVQFFGVLLTIRSSARLDVLDLAGVHPLLEVKRSRTPMHVPLETRGMYGIVRHPLYFAWILIVFATPQMTMTRFIFAVVSSLYLAIAIPFEERSLIHTFGADYRAYQKQVRWRLIPGVY